MLTLDVPYIFDAVGGPAVLLDLLQRVEPTRALNYATVQMWRTRRSVSGPWIVPVLWVMTRRGHSLSDLLVDTADPFGDADLVRLTRDDTVPCG